MTPRGSGGEMGLSAFSFREVASRAIDRHELATLSRNIGGGAFG